MDELDRKVLRFIGFMIASPVLLPYWTYRALSRWIEKAETRDRERLRRIADEQASQRRAAETEVRSQAQAGEQRRRVASRAACELKYSLLAVVIAPRYPRSEFDRFLTTYLSDHHAADEVERRARQLEELLDLHAAAIKPAERPQTIQQLSEWYLRERERIQPLPLDHDMKQTHFMLLDERYLELSQALLQRAQP